MAFDPAVQDHPVTPSAERTLRSLDGVRPLYMLPADPLAEEVLIPGFQAAVNVDCMVGFFSSEVLASLAPGLATYIAGSENSFRLIVSPFLQAEDQMAIEDGLKSPEEIADTTLEELMVTEDLLQRHTLKCLSWLLREGKIEIKVALMKDALFHPKVWIFEDGGYTVAAHGSSNVTLAGIRKNVEQIAVSGSWQDSNQRPFRERRRPCAPRRRWRAPDPPGRIPRIRRRRAERGRTNAGQSVRRATGAGGNTHGRRSLVSQR